MLHAQIGDQSVAYTRLGDGAPLVLLHGLLADSRIWRRQVAALSHEFTVLAWDAPGAGQSTDPPEPFTMAQWADCLSGLLDAIGVDRAHILGLSWGGTLAQEFYRQHPARTWSLILADTYAGWKGSLTESGFQERLDTCLREASMPPAAFLPKWIPGLLTEAAPQTLRDELRSILADFHSVGYRLMAMALADLDTRDLLPQIRIPTLLLWGDADQRAPLTIAHQFHATIPEATLVLIPGAGHVTNLEQPDQFTAAIRAFCRSLVV